MGFPQIHAKLGIKSWLHKFKGSGSNWTTTFFEVGVLYCMACGILFPQLGIELVLPAMAVQSLNLWTIREVPELPPFLFFFKLYSCICFWLLLCEGFLFGEWGLLFVVLCELLTVVASRCGAQTLGSWASVVVAQRLQSTGSVVVAHGLSCPAAYGIQPTRDWTCVPCTDRQILNHWSTREAPWTAS